MRGFYHQSARDLFRIANATLVGSVILTYSACIAPTKRKKTIVVTAAAATFIYSRAMHHHAEDLSEKWLKEYTPEHRKSMETLYGNRLFIW